MQCSKKIGSPLSFPLRVKNITSKEPGLPCKNTSCDKQINLLIFSMDKNQLTNTLVTACKFMMNSVCFKGSHLTIIIIKKPYLVYNAEKRRAYM